MDNSIDYIKIACNGTKSHRNRKNEPPKSFTLLMHVHTPSCTCTIEIRRYSMLLKHCLRSRHECKTPSDLSHSGS